MIKKKMEEYWMSMIPTSTFFLIRNEMIAVETFIKTVSLFAN